MNRVQSPVHGAMILSRAIDRPVEMDKQKDLDVNSLSPIEALNKIYEWQKKFVSKEK